MVGLLGNLSHLYRAQYWDAERIRRSQLNLIARLLDVARREVPMYRDLYGELELGKDLGGDPNTLATLPSVDKDLLKANFPDRIVSERIDPATLYPVATSGTTDRVMLFQDERKRDWDRAADWLVAFQGNRFRPGRRQLLIPADACYERCGADEYGRTETVLSRIGAVLRAGRGMRGSALRGLRAQVFRDWVWREKLLKAFGPDGTAIPPDLLDKYVAEIRAWRPNLLRGLPMFLFILARHLDARADRNGDRLTSIVRPSGGRITPHMARVIEATFGGAVRENFGTAELGTISHDCERSRRQHLFAELFYVEFVRGGRQAGAGELGEMLITDLRNLVCPLIRYRVGDVGTYEDSKCACGRTGLRFTVHSRMSEVIVTPAGRAFAGDQVIDFFLALPAVRFARLLQQTNDRFLLEYVPRPGEDLPMNVQDLSGDFSRFLDHPVTVQPRRVRALIPERSGKYNYVVSRSFDGFHR